MLQHLKEKQRSLSIYKNIKDFVKKWVFRPFISIIKFFDCHNGSITALAITFIVFLTMSLSEDSRRQAKLGRDTLTLSYPPKIDVSHFQIWETSHGHPFRSNPIPAIISGHEITGDVLILNNGRETAFIEGGGCMGYWQKNGRLPMATPLHPEDKSVFPLQNVSGYDVVAGKVQKIVPGQFITCIFETSVPADDQVLYVLGFVYFKDRVGTFRARYFAQRYNAAESVFDIVKDEPKYKGEQ